ncbi:hypothetical protein ACHAW6_000515 [Cyclotella cf. meneghiniana]
MERSLPKDKKRMEHATAAGTWLSTIPDRFSGTELTKDKWLDNADAPLTSLTNATAAVLASSWSTDSAARDVGSSTSAMVMCTTNGPTSAALLSPNRKL